MISGMKKFQVGKYSMSPNKINSDISCNTIITLPSLILEKILVFFFKKNQNLICSYIYIYIFKLKNL